MSCGAAPSERKSARREYAGLGFWKIRLYPDAGEAGGCFTVPRHGGQPREPDPERSEAEASRRARAAIRRYCAANRLTRLGTLTYGGAGCHEREAVRLDAASFFKGLRRQLGGRPLPYLWVPEWHPGGHGLHVHFALGQYVAQTILRDVWGHGIVDIRRVGETTYEGVESARLAARYLAKYVSKDHAEERPRGTHRYEVAQGFQPRSIELSGRTERDVFDLACEQMGGVPSRVWRSAEDPQWHKPPALRCEW